MKENILIVDDEPDIRDMISAVLSDEGYETICVSNAQEAQAKMNMELPSLAILDIWMRDSTMDGLSLLNWVKDSYPEIPVVMISGHGTVEIAVNSIKAGAYDFIEKPFKAEKLNFMIKRALETSGLKKENEQLKRQIRRSTTRRKRQTKLSTIIRQIGRMYTDKPMTMDYGICPLCEFYVSMISFNRKGLYTCINCREVVKKHINGSVKYVPVSHGQNKI